LAVAPTIRLRLDPSRYVSQWTIGRRAGLKRRDCFATRSRLDPSKSVGQSHIGGRTGLGQVDRGAASTMQREFLSIDVPAPIHFSMWCLHEHDNSTVKFFILVSWTDQSAELKSLRTFESTHAGDSWAANFHLQVTLRV